MITVETMDTHCVSWSSGDSLPELMRQAKERMMSETQQIVDYMAEYRTVPELILTGFREDVSWTLEVAKVNGGTLGKTYPADEDWIVNSFVDHELMESVVVQVNRPRTHMDILRDFADCWFSV